MTDNPPEDLVEAVARAIAFSSPDITPKGHRELRWPKDWSPREEAELKKTARAAIAAVRAYDVSPQVISGRFLETRAASCLKCAGITWEQASRMTDAKLLRIPGFGRKTLTWFRAHDRGEG